MLTMAPNTTRNIIANTLDPAGQSDIHDFTFTSSNADALLVVKTGPNTATLTSGGTQMSVDLTVACVAPPFTHNESVLIDDTSISSISVEFA
jgi:hypothetical protein